MENFSLSESTPDLMTSGPVQDASMEADPVLQSHVHEIPNTEMHSYDHSFHNNVERENKRIRPWRGSWSNYNNYHFPRTHHRDNTAGYYGRNQQGCNGGDPLSTNYHNEGQMEQIWKNGGSVLNRYPHSRTYRRDNINNSMNLYGYHGPEYHGWNANSNEQHHARHYAGREKNWTNWGSRSSSFDRQRQPWTNDRRNRSSSFDRQRQPWTTDRQRQPWTNDRQRQPWTYHGNNLSHRGSPHEYHGRETHGYQNGARRTSYGSQNGVERYRFPMREQSRIYYGRAGVVSTSQAGDNVEIAAVSTGLPFVNNGQAEKKGTMWPVPCEGNPLLKQIELSSMKFEHEAEQERERSSVHEETTIVRVPNACLKKKLLILDVNGLLADVIFPSLKVDKADINICRRAIFKRPFLNDFLIFCFEMFDVAIWSSRTKKVLDCVVEYLLGDMRCKLLFCWDQSHCTKTGFKTIENKHKELVLKELKKVWEKHEADLIYEKGDYDESNTLLLDDSPYKALLNPMHTAIFPHSYSYKDESDNSLGAEGDLRVYLTGLAVAENVRRYVEDNPFGQRAIDETNSSWDYYLKVISSQARI